MCHRDVFQSRPQIPLSRPGRLRETLPSNSARSRWQVDRKRVSTAGHTPADPVGYPASVVRVTALEYRAPALNDRNGAQSRRSSWCHNRAVVTPESRANARLANGRNYARENGAANVLESCADIVLVVNQLSVTPDSLIATGWWVTSGGPISFFTGHLRGQGGGDGRIFEMGRRDRRGRADPKVR